MNITENFPYFTFSTTTDTVGSNPEAAVGSECSTGSTTCPTDVVQELETPQPKAVPQPLKQKECTQPEEEKKPLEELLKETETETETSPPSVNLPCSLMLKDFRRGAEGSTVLKRQVQARVTYRQVSGILF